MLEAHSWESWRIESSQSTCFLEWTNPYGVTPSKWTRLDPSTCQRQETQTDERI